MEQETLRAILDGIGDGVVAVDAAGTFLYLNDAARRLIGMGGVPAPPGEWPAAYGVVRPDRVTPVPAEELPLVRAMRGEPTDDVEVFIRNAARSEGIHLSVTGRPLRGADGALRGGVIVFRDIAARHRAEDERKKVNAFLDSIVENIPAMIFVKEAENLRFELFNRAGEELLGWSRETLLGKNDFDFFPKEQAEFFQKRDRDTLREGRCVDIPEEPIRTAGGERWLHTKKIPILDERGMPKYLLGISLDITARKLAEEALQRAKDELELRVAERTADLVRANEDLKRSEEQLRQAQKMEAVGRLAGGIAHDFNNLLLVISGFCDRLLRREASPGPLRSDLEMIHKAADRAASLTRQLLAFSRTQVFQPAVLDLSAVLTEMEGLLRRLIGEDLELAIYAGALPCRVLADRGQLEQVIMNLACNARDAMPQGGKLVIETAAVDVDEAYAREQTDLRPGRYVKLSVGDTGHGMDASTLSHLFEPFFTTKERGKGTGLGLSTVYGVVKQSGGHISVRSEPGKGTTFGILLPGVDAAVSPPPPRADPSTPPRGDETVLLVEDDELVRGLTRSMLEESGYAVLVARDAEEAARVAGSHAGPIHLLLTDVVMPGMGGRDLARRVGALRPGLKVLFMSAYPDDAIVHQGVLEPGVAFFQKPFTADALAWKVREVLGPVAAGAPASRG